MSELNLFRSIIRKTRARLRLQQVLERATTCGALSLAAVIVLLFGYKTRTVGFDSLVLGLYASLAVTLAGAIWGLVSPIGNQAVLKRLDRAHHTRDALGSSHDFLTTLSAEPDHQHRAFMEAQVRRTARLLSGIDPRRASRFRRPRDIPAVGVLSLALVAFLAMGLPVRGTARASVPPVKKIDGITLSMPYYEELTREIRDLDRLAQKHKDPKLAAFLKEYQRLLDALKRGDLTREEFDKAHKALLQRHFPGIHRDQAQWKSLAKRLAKAGKAMSQNKHLKNLAKALKDHDLKAAKKAIDALKKQLDEGKVTPWQRKRIAQALKKAAQQLKQTKAQRKQQQKTDAKINKQVAQAQKKLAHLQKRLSKAPDKASRDRLKRQFRRQQRKIRRLQQQQKRLAQNRRTLQHLSRTLGQLAGQIKRLKLDAQTRKLLAKLQSQLSKYQSQHQRGMSRSQGVMSAKMLKQLLKRLVKNRPGKGQLSDYLKKALGSKGCPTCNGQGTKPGCPKCNGGGLRPGAGLRPGFGPGARPGKGPGLTPGGNGSKPGGLKAGQGHRPGTVNGRPTDLGGNHVNKKVPGHHGKGPSEVTVYKGSAQKGFTSHSYRKVYTSYAKIRQAVINAEQVPPGYRDRIRRYFWLIRPR